MKLFTIIFTIVAAGLIVYNFFNIDFKNPLQGDSIVALITILAALCGIFLLQILRLSKRVESLLKKRKV